MEFYHVVNRSVEKRDIVCSDNDRMRFVKGLYVYNDAHAAPNAVSQPEQWKRQTYKREMLVLIHAWCLMGNHYHILLSPIDDDVAKISLFMKKLNGGYAKFFNEKYERSGYLWQGKYKKIRIERNNQFMYIPYYIHLNPLDFRCKEWREGNATEFGTAIEFLDTYRWSSWQDYTGVKNFPSVLHTDVLIDVLGTREQQTEAVRKIISDDAVAVQSNMIET